MKQTFSQRAPRWPATAWFSAALCLVFLAGCGTAGGEPDPGADVVADAEADGAVASDGGTDGGLADSAAHDVGAVDSGATDSGQKAEDSGVSQDSGGEDTSSADAADSGSAPDTNEQCPGGWGCDCAGNKDCNSGLCLPDQGMSGAAYGRCARPCASIDGCPEDFACAQVEGFAGKFFCVQPSAKLCMPCLEDKDCAFPGAPFAACVDHGAAGGFCGTSCTTDKDCTSGYACADVGSVDGATTKQCVPEKGSACDCGPVGFALAAKTTCHAEGLPGCTATRVCQKDGKGGYVLQDCKPATPAPEKCDGIDSDCDGQPDAPTLCNDNDPCTEDDCAADKGCTHKPDSAAPCDDGNKCTTKDTCKDGKCTAQKVDCNDNNGCTDDACDLASGCTHTFNTLACDDSSLCTKDDVCLAGECTGTAVDCDDGKGCTIDSCAPLFGCRHQFASGLCDDGNACTTKEQCINGVCQGGFSTDCGDDDLCTDDACDMAAGCTHTFNTHQCNDGDPCLLGERCKDGKCGNGKPRSCDDGNPCTTEACVKVGAIGLCKTATTTDACDDGNACTHKDTCLFGHCKGKTVDCNDGNPCTKDACAMATGCTHTTATGACDDGDACTEKDSCDKGKCAGIAKKCDDGNPCTADSCDKAKGCESKPAPGPCDDGNGCTGPDTCDKGKCGGAAVKCDDGNSCTDDACLKVLGGGKPGCTHNANTKPCDDNNVCTSGDVCAGKVCKSKPRSCDDGNPCTADSCDPKAAGSTVGKGCVHKPVPGCQEGVALPLFEAFACDGGHGKDWTLGASHGSSWAVDAKPSPPIPYSPACALNFNNGKDYQCASGNIAASATSPWLNRGALPAGDFTVQFQLNGEWESGVYDTLHVEVLQDGGTWKKLHDNIKHEGSTWKLTKATVKLTAKRMRLRFVFATQDCQFNSTVGPYIDDLAIYPNACSKDTDCPDAPCVTPFCKKPAGTCSWKLAADGSACFDGDKCITATCKIGRCTASSVKTCSGGTVCERLVCEPKTGDCTKKVGLSGNACDDGDPCTLASSCDHGACKADPKAPPACDDKDPCTADSCEGKDGKPSCKHKPAVDGAGCDDGDPCSASSTCKSGKCVAAGPSLCPINEPFACGGGKGWTFVPSTPEPKVGWHVDGTPKAPGFKSPSCSLNFNNGKDYAPDAGTTKSFGHATSPVFTMPAGKVKLQFWSFHGVENQAKYDLRRFQLSTDGFKTVAHSENLPNTEDPHLKWHLQDWVLPASLAGKKVQLRFVFDSVDNFGNGTAGWFIDDVRVIAAGDPS